MEAKISKEQIIPRDRAMRKLAMYQPETIPLEQKNYLTDCTNSFQAVLHFASF